MATTVPSSSFAICLTDPMGEEATSPNRDTQTLDGSMSLRNKRKHGAMQDTAQSPPAVAIDPLFGLDRPSRQAKNAAAEPAANAADVVVFARVSKRLSMKADETLPVPVKNTPHHHLAKTARIAAAKQAGAPPLARIDEDAGLEDGQRPRRAHKMPKRLEESVLLLENTRTEAHPSTVATPAAPKRAQRSVVAAAAAAAAAVPVATKKRQRVYPRPTRSSELGCSRCRYSPRGCSRCKATAAAAGANVEELIEAADREMRARKAAEKLPGYVPVAAPVQHSKRQHQLEMKKATNVAAAENNTVEEGAVNRRQSARNQGIAPPDPVEATKKVNGVVSEPVITEKKRGRKPSIEKTTTAAAVVAPVVEEKEDKEEAVAMDIEVHHPEPEVPESHIEEKEVVAPPPKAAAAANVAASPRRQQNTNAQQQEEQQQQREQQEQGPTWWNPLDPSKVSQAQAALHVSSASVPGQELPLCRDRQISNINTWLADRLQKGQGGSLYLSGLPGTGKSLTALELVRRCGRHLSGNETAKPGPSSQQQHRGVSLPPPALIAVNCMRFSEPKQAVERILAGYHTACRQIDGKEMDTLVQVPDGGAAEVVAHRRRGSSLGGGGGNISSLVAGGGTSKTSMTPQELLRQIVLHPMPTIASSAAVRGQSNQKKGRRRSTAGAISAADTKNATKSTSTTPGVSTAIVGDGCGMIVAVLDELDGLLTGPRGDALVGELFALAHAPRSRLILIGIANSIDLVQQLMRPGGSLHRHNLHPEHEIFPAYLSSQVADVISQRLSRLPGPVFDPKTIQFCARKIANGNGDMRRALEACARAVSIVATEEQKKAKTSLNASGSSQNATNDTARPDSGITTATAAAVVGMKHMAAALAQVTGGIGASNDSVNAIRKLPVPQQLLMATVAKLLGERMGSRGLAVKVPVAPGLGGASAAARFIGTAAIAQPLIDVTVGPTTGAAGAGSGTTNGATNRVSNGPLTTKKARNSLADAHRRRSSSITASSKELTVGDLQAAHAGLCKRVGVTAYSQIEFNVAIDMLCTQGLVELKGGAGKGPLQRVGLQIAEDDVLMALADVPVLKDVVGA